jgi:ketosteroid isomerase-like protein
MRRDDPCLNIGENVMSNPEMQIHRVLEGYKSTVLAKDLEGFLRLYGENVRIFDTWEAWSYEGKKAWRDVIARWFDSLGDETVAVSLNDIQVTVGADLAIASALVTYAAVSPAGQILRSIQNRFSVALAREALDWVIVHEHTSVPIGFGDMRAVTEKNA